MPLLLAALRGQTRPPDEIIVADAGSRDGTAAVARNASCRVVPGGKPAHGRNAGAAVARGQVLVFLDADVLPAPTFLAVVLAAFVRSGCAVATCPLEMLAYGLDYRVLTEASNLYMRLMRSISPRAPGACLIVRRATHRAIGGFDETVLLCEDHDYVQRAARHGGFAILTGTRIPISARRVKSEGIAQLAVKYVWCEAHLFAGKPVRSLPFRYEFGHYDRVGPAPSTGHFVRRLAERAEELVSAESVRELAHKAEELVHVEGMRELAQRAVDVIRDGDGMGWL